MFLAYFILVLVIILLAISSVLKIYENDLYEKGYLNLYSKKYKYDNKSLLSSVMVSNNTNENNLIFTEIIYDIEVKFPDIKINFIPISKYVVIYISSEYAELFINNTFFSKIINKNDENPYILKMSIDTLLDNSLTLKNYKKTSKVVIFSPDGFSLG